MASSYTSSANVASPDGARHTVGGSEPEPGLFRRICGLRSWLAVVGTFVGLICLEIAAFAPAFPSTLHLQLKLPEGTPNRIEPIVATGWVNRGDFLTARFVTQDTLAFHYESWGRAVVSSTVRYQPGFTYPVELEMPSVANAGMRPAKETGLLRLKVGDVELLRHEVQFYPCERHRVFFGENPVGSVTTGALFQGEINTRDGKRVRGNGGQLFPLGTKIGAWFPARFWTLLPIAALALAAGWLCTALEQRLDNRATRAARYFCGLLRANAWFLGCTAVNATIFTWLMSGGTFRLVYPDAFGVFYDAQAQSLLQGRLDVPEWSLGSESFAFGGKHYGYFGLTPALLRLPFVLFGEIGFGHMTRSWMLLDYVACLAAAYALLHLVTRLLRGEGARPSAWAVILLMTAVGLGSTLLYLATRVYVYHEAIICGVAFGLFSAYFSLRYLESPRASWWISALVFGTLCVQARPPIGLWALALLGSVCVVHVIRQWKQPRSWWRPIAVGALAAGGFLTIPLLSYLKFKTFEGAPLRYHVQFTPERLAKVEGRNFHLVNLHHNFDTYLLRPAFQAGMRFPFFAFDLTQKEYPGSKIDIEERTVAIPYSMAGLVALAIAGAFSALFFRQAWLPLTAIAFASIPLTLCMLTFVTTSHRYTADFCPPLVLVAIFGLVLVDRMAGWQRPLLLSIATAASLFSFLLAVGLAFHFQVDLVWGVPDEIKANFHRVRNALDPWFHSR